VSEGGLLLHRKGKLSIATSKSSRLSYSVVVSLSLESILSKISKNEADVSDSVVYFIYQVEKNVKMMTADL
jgi:hypothetical protein